MSDRGRHIRTVIAAVLTVAAVVLMVFHIISSSVPADSDRQAERLSAALEQRMELLDGLMSSSFAAPPAFEDVPRDLVIYRYRNDTLLWWRGSFPVGNDDIRENVMISISPTIRRSVSRPLSMVGTAPEFVIYGTRSYLVKALRTGTGTVIGGIEITDSFDGSFNKELPLDGRYAVQPLSYGSGSPVVVGGESVMLLLALSAPEAPRPSEWTVWLALGLFLAGLILYVSAKRNLRRWLLSVVAMSVVLFVFARHARSSLHGDLHLFSPEVYAGELFTPTLGSLMLLSLGVLLAAVLTYLVRDRIDSLLLSGKWKRRVSAVLALLLSGTILTYVHLCFRDISANSDISLQITDLYSVSRYTVLVYLSLMSMLAVVPMLFHFFFAAAEFRKKDGDFLWKSASRLVYCLAVAVYFVVAGANFGLDKEQKVAATWANRLAMDRDIDLEPRLLSQEFAIASDPIIARLSQLNTANHLVMRRLSDYYLQGATKGYSLSVYLFNEQDWNDPAGINLYNERIRGSEPVSPSSHFMYGTDVNGRTRYSGVFDFFSPESGISRMLICLDPKGSKGGEVFSSLLGISEPGTLILPPVYSYARFYKNALVSFEGEYSYPTRIVRTKSNPLHPGDSRRFNDGGYVHFLNCVDDEEYVTVSRPLVPKASYIIVILFLATLMFLLLLLLFPYGRRMQDFSKTYYKSRISSVILVSILLSLFTMAGISVYFVYKRTRDDRRDLMRSRINDVQTLLQSKLRYVSSIDNVSSSELAAIMEDVGSTLRLDLIMYRPDGKAFQSTTHELFERMLIGTRINEKALDVIRQGNKRYYIAPETIAGHSYQGMYAPIFNSEGQMLGIVFSPYAEDNYAFQSDAAMHILSVLTLLIILLFLAALFASRYVDKMFAPIIDMGRKMSEADLSNLEYIIYDHDDEVSSLVNAYNRMVKAFSDSSRRLAQAERDKAWSEMARQVAHEIKNPLTPIKLRLQMLIRMKESGNPAWTERFDEVSSVVLEHIDILADTANEFSTFAKLYSEEPVEFDLDALIKEEVMLFEGREGVNISYMGLTGARISGPKPQLTRVLVNLVTNSIQALESRTDGEILISLRNSRKEGFYDIVVEDNGPGVKEENRSRLFTPDFTTKTGGSGLGLAICRNIVEKCGGDISYSRSFALGGACFTVRYPKI